jgi:hypothetical protein
MTRRKQHPFKFRTPEDKMVWTFYAPNKKIAEAYAKGWARRHAYRRIIRLKPRR